MKQAENTAIRNEKMFFTKKKACRTLDVVDYPPSFRHHRWHGGEIGFQQNQLGDLCRGITSRCHCNGTVRFLQSKHIIDTVSRHAHGMSRALQCPDKQPLLLRCDPSKYGILLRRSPQSFLRFQCGCIHIVLRASDARFCGNLRNGQRVIAGDDLDGNALLRKVTESLRRIPADGIGQQNQSHGNHRFRQRLSIRCSFVPAEQNRPKTVRAVTFHQGTVLLIITAQDKLRRAEDIGIIQENSSAILVC